MDRMEKLKKGIIPCECGKDDLISDDYMIIQDHDGILKVHFDGFCPTCGQEYEWTSTYDLLEITYHPMP